MSLWCNTFWNHANNKYNMADAHIKSNATYDPEKI
jgi:hypothetical protein